MCVLWAPQNKAKSLGQSGWVAQKTTLGISFDPFRGSHDLKVTPAFSNPLGVGKFLVRIQASLECRFQIDDLSIEPIP